MIPLWFAIALAAPGEEAPVDYRSYLDQARFFVRRGWHADAAKQLEQATRHPDGRLDPEVWFLLAQVRYELADLPGAREAADKALTQSREPAQAAATREWLDFLEQRFGFVELVPPRTGLSSRVSLELEGMILDPELKAWFERAEARLSEPVDLPVTLGLPAGFTYVVAGSEVTVQAGQTTPVEVAVRRVAVQRTELHLSPGVSAWMSEPTANLAPSPSLELGVVVPLGPVVVGARGGPALVAWEDLAGDTRAKPGWTMGGELGVGLLPERAIGIRTGLGLRALSLDGLRPGCPTGDCSAVALAPGLWVSAGWRDPRRSTGVGVGLRSAVERASGTTGATTWSSWGIRALVDVSWSL